MLRDSAETTSIAAGYTVVDPAAYPVAIAGHGARSIAHSRSDPLEINAILLVSGERRCLVLSFDLLYIGGSLERRLRALLASTRAFADRDVLLFASHTHFAPPTDEALPALGPVDESYASRILEKSLALVDELLAAKPDPIVVEVRRGYLDHSVNRRRPRWLPTYSRSRGFSTDRVSFGPHPEGPRDETVDVVTLVNRNTRRPAATIWSYACHPVSHMPTDSTSADFPGAARAQLRERAGGAIAVLFLQGFCGDLRPNIAPRKTSSWLQAFRSKAARLVTGTPWLEITREAGDRWAAGLAHRVAEIAGGPPARVDEMPCFQSELDTLLIESYFDGFANKTALQVRGLRLGRIVEILGLGAEPSTGWRRRLDIALGGAEGIRIYAGYCGDVVGYLPLPEQVREGGYEVVGSQQLFGMRGSYRPTALANVIPETVGSVAKALRSTQPN